MGSLLQDLDVFNVHDTCGAHVVALLAIHSKFERLEMHVRRSQSMSLWRRPVFVCVCGPTFKLTALAQSINAAQPRTEARNSCVIVRVAYIHSYLDQCVLCYVALCNSCS